ncbi:MAG: HDOD domain-containing protein, partial [Planctomycetota bacterium]|nr:HDOD domain-containing protein [Planctomycetota bacterium]
MPTSLDAILASDRLPSLPEVAARIVEIARSPEPDFDAMIEAIRMDSAIAGRVLKTANSALLGMRTRASSIETAVPRLGSTMVRTLVLSFCLAEYQNKNSFSLRPWYQQIWRESLMQAAAAEMLAERQGRQIDPANWFLAGLVQDIGRLALLHTCGEDYVENVLDVDDELSQREREHKWLGFTHVDVGLGLCRRWNLDREIIDSIAVHHASAHRIVPLKFVSSVSLPAALITAAHVAEYLEGVSHNLTCSREHIERLLLQVFGMRPNDIFRMLADVDQRVSEMSAAFGIDIGRPPELEPILAEAQRLLAEIAISSQLRLVNAHVSAGRAERIRIAAEEQVETLQDTAWRDHLTGAFNRAWLGTALDSMIKQSHEDSIPLGLMFVDVDQFKSINDKNGHAAGDVLLQKLTDLIRENV